MAITQQVQVLGMAELERKLKLLRERFDVKTGGVIIRGLREGVKVIRAEARRRVPHVPSGYLPFATIRKKKRVRGLFTKGARILVDQKRRAGELSAMLRSSIVSHAIPTSSPLAQGRPTVVVRVRNSGYDRVNGRLRFRRPGTSPGWWWWVEFGTSKQPAQPFMRPAVALKSGAALEAMRAHVAKEVADLFKKHGVTR
jgi:HK97 gp10 family phage protein